MCQKHVGSGPRMPSTPTQHRFGRALSEKARYDCSLFMSEQGRNSVSDLCQTTPHVPDMFTAGTRQSFNRTHAETRGTSAEFIGVSMVGGAGIEPATPPV